MYSTMDLTTSDRRLDTKSKKKYELSLKKLKPVIHHDPIYTDKYPKKTTIFQASNETANSATSQNFMLRLSDSFLADDTQESTKNEKIGLTMKNSRENEVILISDSSDDETPEKLDWMNLKSSALLKESTTKSISIASNVYTVQTSESEEEDVKKGRGSLRTDNAKNFISVKEPQRKCSILYTSDDTVSDTESEIISNDKENFFQSRINPTMEKIIPHSDESIFNFDVIKGVLTENGRNIYTPECTNNLKGTRKNVEKFRQTPEFTKMSRNETGSAKSLKETNRRIEESRRTPEFTKASKNDTGSAKSLRETYRKIEELRRTPISAKIPSNEAGSGKILKETNEIMEESRRTSEFSKISKIETESAKSLKESNRRIEKLRQTPISAKICGDETESGKSLKETNRRIEKSLHTPEFSKISKNKTDSLNTPKEMTKRSEESRGTPISTKITSCTTALTNKEMRNILKVIKSKRAIFDSPKECKKWHNSDESCMEASDDEILSPESSVDTRENINIKNRVVIAETDEELEDSIIQGSQVGDLSKPHKTHLTRFLDPTLAVDSHNGMSEKKKLEIAHWLMTNSPETRSETSISQVSPSNKNSPSSGNSSLERLEMNYETPNNRDRMRKINTNEKTKTNSTKSMKSIRQTTIDEFVRKTKDGTMKVLTPIAPPRKKDLVPSVNENIEVMGCADILDNLYGNAWRSKADDLLPVTEPRKKNVRLHDKGVQTERRVNTKSKRTTKSSDKSCEDEFDSFVRNIRPNFNSTKKPATKTDRRRCSFINDSSSSAESTGETTYLTAQTDPRISDNRKITARPAPISENIRRAIAICDLDTDDENEKCIDNRKVLSFSDDSDSSTSEFDPNDIVPPKFTTKSHVAPKTPRNPTRTTKTPISVSNGKMPKSRNNFLTSLSASIPINEAHLEAKKYRQDYKNTKEELCKYLYKLYNEKIFDNQLPSDMSIEWNVRMRGTAGFCYNKRSVKALGGVTRSSRIVLATKILDTPDRLRDTLVHEMCHAAAWLINEVSDGHGPFWKNWASKAMRAFPELPPIKRCHDYKITTKFTYRCTGCGYSIGRHSKSLDIEKKRCGHCYGKFELLINKVSKSGTIEAKTPTTKKPSAFALFVKDNYSTVKKERKGVAHKEVMQILGQQFSAVKISKKNNNNSDENNPIDLSND